MLFSPAENNKQRFLDSPPPPTTNDEQHQSLKKENIPIINTEFQHTIETLGIPEIQVNPKPEKLVENITITAPTETINIQKPTSTLNNLINYISHPPATDNDAISKKLADTAIAAGFIGFIGFGTSLLPVLQEIGFSYPLIVSSSLTIAASLSSLLPMALFVKYAEHKEMKSRIPFGELLTVSKVFPSSLSTFHESINNIFPKYKPKFIGELHFVGNGYLQENHSNIEIATQGVSDLLNLAINCQNDSPDLKGIDIFCGFSHMLNKKYERFGFKISDPPKKNKLNKFFDKISTIFSKKRENTKIIEPSTGIITRQELVDQIPKLQRYKDILEKQTII
ncbi:MAG: hypothetical protein WC069_05615 [Candidatus Shapirobacteria bacterium]